MSEVIHVEEHSSPIKTPTQLIVVVVLSFVVPIALIAMLAHLATRGGDFGKGNPAMSDEAVAKRLKPVGEVVVADPNAPKIARSGKEITDSVCAACHATGALNAPKIGDKAAWAKLIKAGHEKLTQGAIKGVRQMPPRGGNPDLSDIESRALSPTWRTNPVRTSRSRRINRRQQASRRGPRRIKQRRHRPLGKLRLQERRTPAKTRLHRRNDE